ncbi:MAG: hypothetical protein P4N41_11865 [Negativicutes bacterium]|nr:hypothetical protein [Negativicutes bacterium]
MGKEAQKTTTYTLTKEEVEKMLLEAHGSKLQPVDTAQVARLRRQQANYDAKREKAQSQAEDRKTEETDE